MPNSNLAESALLRSDCSPQQARQLATAGWHSGQVPTAAQPPATARLAERKEAHFSAENAFSRSSRLRRSPCKGKQQRLYHTRQWAAQRAIMPPSGGGRSEGGGGRAGSLGALPTLMNFMLGALSPASSTMRS